MPQKVKARMVKEVNDEEFSNVVSKNLEEDEELLEELAKV